MASKPTSGRRRDAKQGGSAEGEQASCYGSLASGASALPIGSGELALDLRQGFRLQGSWLGYE